MFMLNVWHLPAPFHPHSDILSVFASGSLQIQKLWLTWLDSNKTSRQRSLVFRAFILYLQTYWQNLEINEKHHINFWWAHQSRLMQMVSKTEAKLIILSLIQDAEEDFCTGSVQRDWWRNPIILVQSLSFSMEQMVSRTEILSDVKIIGSFDRKLMKKLLTKQKNIKNVFQKTWRWGVWFVQNIPL